MSENKIKIYDQQTKQLETDLNKEVGVWEKIIKELTYGIKGNIKSLPEVESNIINYKQEVDASIRKYSLLLNKDVSALKPLKKKRFEYYNTSYNIKVKNSGDIKMLTESDINKMQYRVDLLDTHIDFLRDTSSNFKTLTYSFKNRIDLLNILGLD